MCTYVLFLQIRAHSPSQSEEKSTVQKNPRARTHARIHARTHKHARTHARTRTHTHTHTHTHKHTRTHAHTHTHTRFGGGRYTQKCKTLCCRQCDGNLTKLKSVVSKSEVRLDSEARREAGPEANSKHWFTTSFLQPLPYLVTS